MAVSRPWRCAACGDKDVKQHCPGNPNCPWIRCNVCGMLTILVRGRPEARNA